MKTRMKLTFSGICVVEGVKINGVWACVGKGEADAGKFVAVGSKDVGVAGLVIPQRHIPTPITSRKTNSANP